MTRVTRGWPARAVMVLMLAWTLAVTVLRTVRWPNDFAEAHWLLDYRLGLVKRGLPGEVLGLGARLVGGRPTEGLIADVSALVFGLLLAALLVVVCRIVIRAGWTTGAVIAGAAFLSSSYVVMAAHLVGYFDHLVVLSTIVALGLILRERPWWSLSVLAGAMLVHEHTLLVGFPSVVIAWMLVNDRRRARGDTAMSVWPLLLPLASFAALAVAAARLSAGTFEDTFARHLETFPFVGGDMHLLVPQWLSVGVIEGAAAQAHRFVERIVSRDLLMLIVPTTLALLAVALDRFTIGGRLRVAAVVAAVAAPQLLHLAGWDTMRIWTFSIVVALLCAWVAAEVGQVRAQIASPAVPLVAMTALVANAAFTTPLYDYLNEWHDLGTRMWLYSPVLAGGIWLLVSPAAAQTDDPSEYSADGA